jgi:hypothetical protein
MRSAMTSFTNWRRCQGAPDMRVAISAAIVTPSRTTLQDGHVKFIVFRRDSATNAADHAEVRVIAKIPQEMSFDKAGKPLVTKVEDSWVIRNISIPYRTAPKKDYPDMYEVQSENPAAALPPGRYALVLKGQSYDFTVAGPVTRQGRAGYTHPVPRRGPPGPNL